MYVKVKITKIRTNKEIPFKDPSQPLNHPTWEGYIDFESLHLSEDYLTQVITHIFQNRNFFENPNLNKKQLAVKQQSEKWFIDNNISVVTEIIEI